MLNAGQVLEGRYRIIKQIGKGGMSTVYQAQDVAEGTLLAVKEVARTGDEPHELVEKSLIAESEMLKRLSDPHLPKIYDLIIYPDKYMLVMDFVQGESLDRVILREGAQPMDRVLDWGMQICEVFAYLHGQPTPIIYRDMKPANLMVQPNGHLMMIDFGTARTQKRNVLMTADTICFGTAGFAAPEQFGGIGQSTPRTDIFCLGGTLYNMITGHSPCDRPQGILPLERWDPALKDTPISYIILKCTRNDPAQRYQTAMELYEDLRKARQGTFDTSARSGELSKGLWQRQDMKPMNSVGGGLSGLLKLSRNLAPQKPVQPERTELPVKEHPRSYDGAGPVYPASRQSDAAKTAPPLHIEDVSRSERSAWRKLTMICLIIAVVTAMLGMGLLLAQQFLPGMLSVIVGMGAALLALIGAFFVSRT